MRFTWEEKRPGLRQSQAVPEQTQLREPRTSRTSALAERSQRKRERERGRERKREGERESLKEEAGIAF